jgi:O-antigen/teichoic acid export membrane protein
MIKQFLMFSYGSLGAAAISFFSTPIVTLLVLPVEFGKSSMFALALNFIYQVGMLGMDQSFIRMFYEKKDIAERVKLAKQCFIFALLATALIICCLLPFWRWVSTILFEEVDIGAVLILAGCLPMSLINRFTISVLRMNKRGNAMSITQIIGAFVNVCVVIVYAKYVSPSFYAIVWGTAASLFVSIAVSALLERQFWTLRTRWSAFDRSEMVRVFRYGLPLVPAFVITTLFQSMDKIALRAVSSFEEIGLYAAASKFVFMLTIIHVGFSTFWHPLSLERYEADRSDYRFFEKMFEYMAVVALMSAGALLLAKDVVIFLFAPAYRSAVMIMPFLLLVPLMHMLSDIIGVGIKFKERTYFYTVVAVAGALVNFIGNYYLIPIYGARGAAVSTGIAYTVYFLMQTWISGRFFPVRFKISRALSAFLTLTLFMALNTFYAVPWWCNVTPIIITALLYRGVIMEMARQGVKEFKL